MEEVLLGIACVGAEIAGAKRVEMSSRDPATAGFAFEIQSSQCTFNPDIHRESLLFSVSEEQHAVSDLGADAGQSHESVVSVLIGKRVERVEMKMF